MFMRRRPLLRAAAIGGGAYVAGKKVAQHSAQQADQSSQDAQNSNPEQQPGAQPAGQPGPGAVAADQAAPISEQLKQLTTLHEGGSLSDTEFAAAKRQLLGI